MYLTPALKKMLRTIHTSLYGPYGLDNHKIQNEYAKLISLTIPTYSASTLNKQFDF